VVHLSKKNSTRKGKIKRRPSDPIAALKLFNTGHPELELHKRSQRDLIRFLVYWAIEIHGAIAVFPNFLTDLFDALDLNAPADPANALAKLKYEDELVKMDVGYRPSAHLKEAMKEELDHMPPLLRVEPGIGSLLKKVTRPDAKNFLDEAHLCLRANAPRAAIVMTWIVVIDHIYEYVLTHKLADFNIELAKKFSKVAPIKLKDDFAEIKREKDFIEICRSANVFNNDVRKILDEKLGIRNTAGHPSTVTVHGTKAANFIEDLVENVVLKFPI
jgi:hypothetical protein